MTENLNLPKVSIIILNWNKLDYLKRCVESAVKNTDYPNYEIIILDNASTEGGTKEYLTSLSYKVIFAPVNLGFAKGNNEVVKYASGEYLLLLNNDTIAKYDWLTPMIELTLNNPECGIVGGKLLYPDGTIQHIGVYLNYKGRRKHYFRKYPENIPEASKVRECEAVTAACLLIKKSIFEEVGGFDERYIQGVEDIDLCLKVRELGYKIFFCPQSILTRFEGTSWKDLGDKKWQRLKKKARKNNERLFYKKWGGKIDSMRLESQHSRFKPHDYFVRDFSTIVKLIPEGTKSILNVGCGKGVLGKALKVKGIKEVWGIEIDPLLASEAVFFMDRVITGDIENIIIPERKNSFDCIVMTDVLEHLKDPWSAFKKLTEYLSEDGVMIASISNIRHYRVIKDIIKDRWFYCESGILDSSHLRFFGLSAIKHLFSVADLDIQKIERLKKAKGIMKILNLLTFGSLQELLTFQYLIVAKKKKHIRDENSPKLKERQRAAKEGIKSAIHEVIKNVWAI